MRKVVTEAVMNEQICAKQVYIEYNGSRTFHFFLSQHGTISKILRIFALGFGFVSSPRHFGKT